MEGILGDEVLCVRGTLLKGGGLEGDEEEV